MARIVCFNSPRGTGKDEAAGRIHRSARHAAIVPVALAMKQMTCERYGLPVDAWPKLDETKDTPMPLLDGKTPREAYIETRRIVEAKGAHAVWAELWTARAAELIKAGTETILVPDCRFSNEYAAAISLVGVRDVLLAHLVREGHNTWRGDIGEWITPAEGGAEWVIINDHTLDQLHSNAMRMWRRWTDPTFEPRKTLKLAHESRAAASGG